MSATSKPNDRAARAAKNQSLFRDVNERVKDLNQGFSLVTPMGEWICECANESCFECVEMSADEYEAIRRDGARFFVAPNENHVWAEVEAVVARHDRYWVLEKRGRAGALAEQADPRSTDGPLRLRTP
jgi:hypothetical protein